MKNPTRVTTKLAREIREARQAGATLRELTARFDVCEGTIRRYSSDADAAKLRAYEQARYRRIYDDPIGNAEKIERRRQRAREYHARIREETRKLREKEA